MQGKPASAAQGGFTLLELLVVVCILGILCGLALPRINFKKTAMTANGAVVESGYDAASAALFKRLAMDPLNPPTLQELAQSIDSKRTIYTIPCSPNGPPGGTTQCLAIDVNGNGIGEEFEIFAIPYNDGECTVLTGGPGDTVCCLTRRDFFNDPNFPTPTSSGPGQPINGLPPAPPGGPGGPIIGSPLL